MNDDFHNQAQSYGNVPCQAQSNCDVPHQTQYNGDNVEISREDTEVIRTGNLTVSIVTKKQINSLQINLYIKIFLISILSS